MKTLLAYIFVVGGIICLLCGGWVFRSCMEARTYRHLTGMDVSTWDAMWIQLRVIEPGKAVDE
jgi:hypothetical protein